MSYLVVHSGIWGPHLIIVPTSCIVNWECELKRFCPAFKILTYFGSAKQRKALRVGWSKLNSFHICITSYQIVLSDANMFKRKRWYYMILDEAHHIKNYLSKKWQTLLGFNTFRRLLLSGTPLQNNVLELWSLLHFLMPHLFNSRKEFAYWFSDPLNKLTENSSGGNGGGEGLDSMMAVDQHGPQNQMVGRLHTIIRPFILRRLKSEVATQLPNKFEYVLYAKMSKRQLYLYEEFIAANQSSLSGSGGSYISMMNILMQLRKICNHPDLLEPRIIETPYIFPSIDYCVHRQCLDLLPRKNAAIMLQEEIRPVFVEDVHCRELDDYFQKNEKMNLLSQAVRQYLHALLVKSKTDESNRSPAHIWPRLTPYYTSFAHSTMLTSLDIKASQSPLNKRRANWREVSLHATLAEELINIRNTATQHFLILVPKVLTSGICLSPSLPSPQKTKEEKQQEEELIRQVVAQRTVIVFPDKKLLQYDCGKLQLLADLLEKIKGNRLHPHGSVPSKYGHMVNKVLIFTQMSKMLDLLECFLNLHNWPFLRLDGSTAIEKRQSLMDQFNNDPKVFVFILSTRSGGLGINLTGANHVIFYDTG